MSRGARTIDHGLQLYLDRVRRYPKLDREAEVRLSRAVRAGDERAAVQLVEANLRYAVAIALGFQGYGLPIGDLIGLGNVGLVEAARRFDPERERRFMTYATFWVRAMILAHVLRSWSLVSLGTGPLASKLFFGLARERARLAAELGLDPADSAGPLAERFETTPERIGEMEQRLDGRDLSIDGVAPGREGAVPLVERLADERPDQEAQTGDAEARGLLAARVRTALGALSARERHIAERRLLDDDERQTLAEIGRELGLSRERVRQLEERIRAKLQHALSDLEHLAA